MKYVDEFRDIGLVDRLASRIRALADKTGGGRFMEVCGTHTMSIFKFGLKDRLPANIGLVSGPGCPVCVTPNEFIDKAVALAGHKDVIIATFGDMLRVPGSHSSLEMERARGGIVKTVYSTLDAVDIARKNPSKEVVFLGVGFETTAPTVAASILSAKCGKVPNYSVLCGHKTMPEALRALVSGGDAGLDGFILPGHVSAIIGTKPYEFLAETYGKGAVIAGFEPVDIMQAILMLVSQKKPKVEIQYTRVISKNGNLLANKTIGEVFESSDSQWRGMGTIRASGLVIRRKYSAFDAEERFDLRIAPPRQNRMCICGDVLKGKRDPSDCRLFGKICSPAHPAGACMVSSEGACAAYYKYRRLGMQEADYDVPDG